MPYARCISGSKINNIAYISQSIFNSCTVSTSMFQYWYWKLLLNPCENWQTACRTKDSLWVWKEINVYLKSWNRRIWPWNSRVQQEYIKFNMQSCANVSVLVKHYVFFAPVLDGSTCIVSHFGRIYSQRKRPSYPLGRKSRTVFQRLDWAGSGSCPMTDFCICDAERSGCRCVDVSMYLNWGKSRSKLFFWFWRFMEGVLRWTEHVAQI
jgi:hypothetical protein